MPSEEHREKKQPSFLPLELSHHPSCFFLHFPRSWIGCTDQEHVFSSAMTVSFENLSKCSGVSGSCATCSSYALLRMLHICCESDVAPPTGGFSWLCFSSSWIRDCISWLCYSNSCMLDRSCWSSSCSINSFVVQWLVSVLCHPWFPTETYLLNLHRLDRTAEVGHGRLKIVVASGLSVAASS